MAIAAQDAIRAWINARADLVGEGLPLNRGAYLREQRSPADGAYTVLSRGSEGIGSVVAEGGDGIGTARMQFLVYAGTETASEAAAAALREAFETLQGCPEPCGSTGVTVRVAYNHLGPILIPVAPDAGEIYCHQVNADFLLTEAI
jgi:hypothetical protein